MTGPQRHGFVTLFPAFFFAALAALAWLASLLDYPLVKGWLDTLATDGEVGDIFTLHLFQNLASWLRLAGAGLGAAAVGLWFFRERTKRILAGLASSLERCLVGWTRLAVADLGSFYGFRAFCLLAVTAIGVYIRLLHLEQPIRYDEAYTFMNYASRSWLVALSWYESPNNQVLHTLLVKLSLSLFGEGLAAIRLPALLAGVAMIPATYACFRFIYGPASGILAAAMAAGSSFLIEYSTDARGYTLIGLFFLCLVGISSWLREHPEPAGWVLWALLAALGLWTSPAMAFPLATVCLWWLLSPYPGAAPLYQRLQLGSFALACAGALALTAVFYLPVIIASGWAALAANQFVDSSKGYLRGLEEMLWTTWDAWTCDLHDAKPALAGVGASLLMHRVTWRRGRRGFHLGLTALLACGALMAWQGRTPPVRVWLFLLPLFLGLQWAWTDLVTQWLRGDYMRIRQVGAGLFALALAGGLSFGVWHSGSVFRSEETGTLRAAAEIVDVMQKDWRPGDKVAALNPSAMPLMYHFRARCLHYQDVTTSRDELRRAERVWVVLKENQGEPLRYLRWSDLDPGPAFASPRMIGGYDGARLFVLERRR